MKGFKQKATDFLRMLFGYGIVISLFAGVGVFLGYVIALIIGGDAAAVICDVLYKGIIPVLVYFSTSCILLGLLVMYLSNEFALTVRKK